MGAPPEDYAKYAPEGSYINVEDFDSPLELAKYLMFLDKDDVLYNEYFQWRGTGQVTKIQRSTFVKCARCFMITKLCQRQGGLRILMIGGEDQALAQVIIGVRMVRLSNLFIRNTLH